MIKCANCETEAIYRVADPGANPVDYCGSCLPYWLHDRANANHFPLVNPVVEIPIETPVEPPVEVPVETPTDAEAPVDESN